MNCPLGVDCGLYNINWIYKKAVPYPVNSVNPIDDLNDVILQRMFGDTTAIISLFVESSFT
ncbi:MAG: hypothetical protein C5B44_03285 [Acidobacteria bacterium]|nr:MAG: hypothetical protein C5B44_03285 [Acidobacteriota bacterium]